MSHRIKWDIQQVETLVHQLNPGVELEENTYVNNRAPMQFICVCGQPFAKSLDTILHQKKCLCNGCSKKEGWASIRRGEDFVKEAYKICQNRGFRLLETPKNYKDKILCENSEGYRGKISLENIRLGKTFSVFSVRFNLANLYYNICLYAQKHCPQTTILKIEKNNRVKRHVASSLVLTCKCECGNIFQADLGIFTTQGQWRCYACTSAKSKLELKVEAELLNYLSQSDIVWQKRFADCVNPLTNYVLPFDFYLPKYNTIIEVDGPQHFFPVGFHQSFTEQQKADNFLGTVKRDKIKTEYCKEHHINLIRISFEDCKTNIYKEKIQSIFNQS